MRKKVKSLMERNNQENGKGKAIDKNKEPKEETNELFKIEQ